MTLFSLLFAGAIVRYYKTKRNFYLQSLPENQQKTKQDNKVCSRRKGPDFNVNFKISFSFSVHELKWRSPRANKLMSRLQRRIYQSREEGVRPHVPRVEGPLSEGGRVGRRG
ncbi:unnamed protein product [Porites lobata]|uniref:Uncharacterized protein n=1 Tax=Porites lobata TaxID=104759 RepID=A0ABN8RCQ7_9CNID|nr:unnamed protein product [Porites lobata]